MSYDKERVKLDEVLKTLFSTSQKALVGLINGIFDENLSSNDVKLTVGNNEFVLEDSNYDIIRGDLFLQLLTEEANTLHYHIEFQTLNDSSMAIRMLGYGFQKSKEISKNTNNIQELYFPKQVVIFIEENNNIQDELKLKVIFPNNQSVIYTVPVLKYWEYDSERLVKNKMYPLLPLQIFTLRKDLEKVTRNPSTNTQEEMDEILGKARDKAFAISKESKRLYEIDEILGEDLHKMLLAVNNLIGYLSRGYGQNTNFEEEVEHMTKSLYDPLVEERGKVEGKIEALLSVLTGVFGSIPDEVILRIRNASSSEVDNMLKNVIKIKDINDIERYI